MRYHINVDESNSQEQIGAPLMTAEQCLLALAAFRGQSGNVCRAIEIIDETGGVLVSEDRHHTYDDYFAEIRRQG